MPPTLADLQSAILELQSNLHASGPLRFKNPMHTGHLINYLEANLDEILEVITEGSPPETESTTSESQDVTENLLTGRKPHRVILYLAAEDWEILEETLRMDSESKNIEPDERRRIQTALDAIEVVRGLEIRFEPDHPNIEHQSHRERKAYHRAEGDGAPALKSVRFLPVRFGIDEIVVAVVTARVTPDLVNQTQFLEALKRAVTDWVCDTEAGRSFWEFSGGNLNIGDFASQKIDESLAQRLAAEGIHDLYIDELLAYHRWQAWLYEEGLLHVTPDEEEETEEACGPDL